jgi:hypothetical protein
MLCSNPRRSSKSIPVGPEQGREDHRERTNRKWMLAASRCWTPNVSSSKVMSTR